jgi:hypothetical protein
MHLGITPFPSPSSGSKSLSSPVIFSNRPLPLNLSKNRRRNSAINKKRYTLFLPESLVSKVESVKLKGEERKKRK